MHKYSSLSTRDASWYFDRTHAVHNKTKVVKQVRVVEGNEGGSRYALHVGSAYMRPDDFFEEWSIHKFPIGWVNVDRHAAYITGNPTRTTKKGFTNEDLIVAAPYSEALRAYAMQLRTKLLLISDMDQRLGSPYHGKYSQVSNALHRINRQLSPARLLKGQGVHGTLAQPEYFSLAVVRRHVSLDKAVPRSGWAVSPDFAFNIIASNINGGVGLYYRSKLVGNLVDSNVQIFERYRNLVPQFQREVNGEVRVV